MDQPSYGRSRRRPKRPDFASEKSKPADEPKPVETDQTPPPPPPPPPPPAEDRPKQQPVAERKPAPTRRPSSSSNSRTKVPRRPISGTVTGIRPERDSRSRTSSRRTQSSDRKPPARDSKSRTTRTTRPTRPTPRTASVKGLQFQSLALPAITVMAGTAFLYYAAPILVPLTAAITFAYILSPLVMLLKKIKVPHIVAVLLVMLFGAAALSGAAYLIFQETVNLAGDMPTYYEAVKGWLVIGLEQYDGFRQSTGNLLPVLDESLLEGISFADFSGVGSYLFKGIGSVFSSVWGFILIVLLTLFLLLDQDSLGRRFSLALGGDQKVSGSIVRGINEQIRGFLVVKFATTIALAIIFTVALLLFKVPYAYVWGPLAGVLNLIPYVGAIIGMIPPVIVAAIQTGEFATPFWVLLFFVVIQLLESNVITPKLVGNKVNLNLLAVLMMTVYWGWLWGMLGVLLAVPITGAIKVVCSHIEPLRPIAILLGGDPGEISVARTR